MIKLIRSRPSNWRISANAEHQLTIEDDLGRVIAVIVDESAITEIATALIPAKKGPPAGQVAVCNGDCEW